LLDMMDAEAAAAPLTVEAAAAVPEAVEAGTAPPDDQHGGNGAHGGDGNGRRLPNGPRELPGLSNGLKEWRADEALDDDVKPLWG
jgi:hypothetical protein